ncbi:MAG: hypothetical protein KDD58_08880 [Bdellovibrionales bacterium]|nr:hypothetical protein [Bdellovibrionales bacterium]
MLLLRSLNTFFICHL